MAVFSVYIEKEAIYFGTPKRFGNTYHYQTAPGQVFDDAGVAQECKTAEEKVTQSSVKFIGWTTWGPTDGTPLANVIRESGNFTGLGLNTVSSAMYMEACALVVWEISRSLVLNRRRWLRKFVRLPGFPGGSITAEMASGRAALDINARTALLQYADDVAAAGGVGSDAYRLCTENGDGQSIPGQRDVRPYLFTRDIGR